MSIDKIKANKYIKLFKHSIPSGCEDFKTPLAAKGKVTKYHSHKYHSSQKFL